MLESNLEGRLKREVGKLGGMAAKWTSPGLSGVPDRVVLLPGGQTIFVEMKSPGKPLRPLQAKRKKELEALGFRVYKLDSISSIDQFIQEVSHEIQSASLSGIRHTTNT
ncbi:MAG: hypothetical protein K0Q73_5901 [Paenibacillus sp.]|jgi:hypothetical protein|nr:hypothetical protein [Paenibacillus sp.]